MIPGAFDCHRPSSVAEAVAALARLGSKARVLAGGHSLVPMMKQRMAAPEHLVDLQGLAELRGIHEADDAILIGALTTQAEVIASSLSAERIPLLKETALQIADPQIRAFGTIGGNVSNGDPGNDMPAVMQALDAVDLLERPTGPTTVPARAFYEGAFVTALADGEILTGIRIPVPPAGHGWSYQKRKRKIGDYATAAVAVVLTMDGTTCRNASVALTNVADTPLFAADAGSILTGSTLDQATLARAAAAAEAITDPAADGRGPPAFRRKLTGVLLARAVAAAAGRAS